MAYPPGLSLRTGARQDPRTGEGDAAQPVSGHAQNLVQVPTGYGSALQRASPSISWFGTPCFCGWEVSFGRLPDNVEAQTVLSSTYKKESLRTVVIDTSPQLHPLPFASSFQSVQQCSSLRQYELIFIAGFHEAQYQMPD